MALKNPNNNNEPDLSDLFLIGKEGNRKAYVPVSSKSNAGAKQKNNMKTAVIIMAVIAGILLIGLVILLFTTTGQI